MRLNSGNLFILICLLIPATAISQPDTLWTSTIDIEQHDASESVLRTSDGYLVAGHLFDGSYYNYFVIKIDTDGSLMWENTYSDPALEFCGAYEILEAPENDEFYVFGSAQLIGTSYLDIRILRIDADGNLLEETMFGGAFEDWLYAAANTSDSGYIIACAEGNYPHMDIQLTKVDSQLDIEWQKEYGGTLEDYPSSVIQTSDGGYLVTGWTYSFGAQYVDCYLIKTDSDGNVEWETTYGSPLFDRMVDVCETDDGSFIGLWMKYNPTSTTIVKIDQMGTIEWKNEHVGRNASQLLQNDDGTIVITGVGVNNHSLWLMCADTLGNCLWETFLNAGFLNHCGHALCFSHEGGYFVAASKNFIRAELDIWLLNFENYTGINVEGPASVDLAISSIWPTPFQSSVFLEYSLPAAGSAVVSVYDAAGRIVDSFDQSILPEGSNSFCWTPDETLPAGCYTLMLEACGETASRRCVLLR